MTRPALIGVLLLAASALGAQGYRIVGNQVRVDAQHLPAWNFPANTLDFDAQGAKPRFVRQQINAALNARLFADKDGNSGGVRDAGSNLALAANLIDGANDTFWEPAADAPLQDWWVEIDLGRAVWVKKIVVKFAEEDVGDPFLQFNLLTSSGLTAFSQSKVLNYGRAGRSEGLNKTQRVFEFELQPTVNADEGFIGDVVRYVQIVATASDLGQAQEVSKATWDGLPDDERGDVLYFRREQSGVERLVDKAEYEALSSERQGTVSYFRRERPRLAEVEVWTVGDNISLEALERGGQIIGYGNLGAEVLTLDGDYTTFWSVEVGFNSLGSGDSTLDVQVQDPIREIFLDLGTWYWLDRLLFVFDNLASGGAFPNYVVNLSDGTRAPDGSLIFTTLGERGRNGVEEEDNRGLFYQENAFPLTKARFLKVDYRILQHSIRSGVRELQVYGRGFIPRVSTVSTMIELGSRPRILSNITWDADVPAGTELHIRTRTGNELDDNIIYFDNKGKQVSKERYYGKLASFQRGDSLISQSPGEDWSNWSSFYEHSGASITSPSPRRFAMIEATLLSENPEQAVTLHNLRLNLDTPLADQILGEIAPRRVLNSGQPEIVNLYLQPTFRSGNRGFDQVLLVSSLGVEIEVVEARVGAEDELENDGGVVYALDEIEQVESGPDSLWLRLPQIVESGFADIVALRLIGSFYLASNAFTVSVGLGSGSELVWQRVDAGDVIAFAQGRDLVVQTPFDGGLVGDVEMAPNPFTPNGDGVNDRVRFSFPVFKVQGDKALVIEIYNLSGRRVGRVERLVSNVAGHQSVAWDGRDAEGELVAPGIYICRVGLEVDDESAERTMVAKLVAVAY